MAKKSLNVDYVNPFIEATCHVLRTMLRMEVTRGPLYGKRDAQPSLEVSGIINMSGAADGTIVLGMSAGVAIEATRILAGETPRTVDAMVVDAIGELTNIIAGNAKSKLEALKLRISLPRVITGRRHAIAFPLGGTPIGIPFQCASGPITMEVSLVERDSASQDPSGSSPLPAPTTANA
jgi:chemotaxis protein CheX